jgi:carboxypeptidase C (cathepsin A)
MLRVIQRTYTGYVDTEAKHLFFWFFESRNSPDEDDVVLWVNGGTNNFACVKSHWH